MAKSKWMSEKEFRAAMLKDFNEGATDCIEDFEEYYDAMFQARDDDGYVKYENGKYFIYW